VLTTELTAEVNWKLLEQFHTNWRYSLNSNPISNYFEISQSYRFVFCVHRNI